MAQDDQVDETEHCAKLQPLGTRTTMSVSTIRFGRLAGEDVMDIHDPYDLVVVGELETLRFSFSSYSGRQT